MEQIEPIISGSSGPRSFAAANHGIKNDKDATSVVGIIPFSALIPRPQMQTIRNGEINVSTLWITATFPDKERRSTPVTDASVTVGTPTEPNAVGVELTTRHPITALNGSSPIPASMEAGIATAVPNPAIPSMKLPNPHPMISARTRLSFDTLASIFLICSISPVFIVRL